MGVQVNPLDPPLALKKENTLYTDGNVVRGDQSYANGHITGASGHEWRDPKNKANRYRQRLLHLFKYCSFIFWNQAMWLQIVMILHNGKRSLDLESSTIPLRHRNPQYNWLGNEPHHAKRCLQDFWPGKIQTSLLSQRNKLQHWNWFWPDETSFNMRRYSAIKAANKKMLMLICAFVGPNWH